MKLDILSNVDSKKFPNLYVWDTVYRANHAFYQQKIDEIAFHLQKTQRSWHLPHTMALPSVYFQKDLMFLELYKKKQVVGRVTPEEVQHYKAINPNIAQDLNRTFNTKWHLPWVGFGVGCGVFAFAHLFNFQYSLRAGLFLLPVCADILWFWSDKSAYFRSTEFLDFLIEFRRAKCRVEYDEGRFDGGLLQRLRDYKLKGTLEENYEQVIRLAREEKGEWKEE